MPVFTYPLILFVYCCLINYYNFSSLKSIQLSSHCFCESEIQAQLSWALCLGHRKEAIRVIQTVFLYGELDGEGSFPDSLRLLAEFISMWLQNCLASCWLMAAGFPQVPEAALSNLPCELTNMEAYFFKASKGVSELAR